jgi:mRNA-degrading endonuclease HigB of HigAB toxin-antitoxin module
VVNNALVNSSGYATVNLAEGSNSLRVTVYAEDCKASTTYTISINRGASGSSDSTLSGLEVQVRAGTGVNQTYNLIPAFNKAIFNYSSNVNDDVTLVSFRPTATDSGAQIYMSGSYITSGQWTANTSVNSGANTFSFQVTSADGSNTSTYTLTVQRGLRVGPSTQTLWVDGKQITCAAYNINGNNYFKLRDLAYALKGTSKHFNVTYNAATRVVSMISNQEYSPIGGEMVMPGSYKKCIPTNQTIMLDNRNVSLIVYNIDGNNYFMLREIGALFDFGVTYNDADRRVDVNTSIGYTPDIRWSN